MAIFRNVNMTFWTDTKVIDDFTPEDKYFMLYALTNQYTNIIGCYEISLKQMANDLGYTKDSVENLIKRFITLHKNIDYDFNTKELYVKNWNKYNWSSSPKLDMPLFNAIEKVKSDKFHDELAMLYNNRDSVLNKEDTVLIPYRYPIDTTITITNTIPITNTITNSISNTNSINKEKETKFKEEFELLWKQYPNKKGKPNALKSYIKARKKGTSYEDVENGLNSYIFYIREKQMDMQYVKHGSTWFNQECWNDDYTVIKRVEQTREEQGYAF